MQFVIGLLAAGVLALVILLVILFRQNLQRQAPLGTSTVTPTEFIPAVFVPTLDCGTPTLVIGTTTYQIQTIQRAPDGTFSVPQDDSGSAYWVADTDPSYVFILSPTTDNIALQTSLTTGDLVTVNWADCTTQSFVVSAVETGQLNDPSLLVQSSPGMAIFIQADSTLAGFVVKGEAPEAIISVIDTPRPDESGILAEVSLLETSASPDGITIEIGISILNYGQSPFTLSTANVSLTPLDSPSVILAGSEPSLPKEIKPGSTETFLLTFPRPTVSIATLKVFTIEYDIEGY
jgi:hypothetical protein